MRITIAIDTFSPIGGSERYAIDIARALASLHEVTVVAGRGDAHGEVRLLIDPTYSDAALDATGQHALVERFQQTRPDVVFVLSARSLRTFRALVRALPVVRFVQDHVPFCPAANKTLASGEVCRTPLGWTCVRRYFGAGCHGVRRKSGQLSPLPIVRQLARRRSELRDLARCRRVLVASDYMRNELRLAGLAATQVDVVPYFSHALERPSATAALNAATSAFLAASPEPWVFACGRFAHPDKGFDHLITALGKLARPTRAVLAGDGPARAWLERKSREEGLGERIHFPGWLDQDQLAELYTRACVVAFPSTWDEPFGLVGIEAAAHATPVVAYDVGGVRTWLVDGTTGELVPRGDRDRFAAALDGYLSDALRAKQHGQAAREHARQEFAPTKHLARLTSCFQVAVSRGRVGAP